MSLGDPLSLPVRTTGEQGNRKKKDMNRCERTGKPISKHSPSSTPRLFLTLTHASFARRAT